MPKPRSPAIDKALEMIEAGATPKEAAKASGCPLASVYGRMAADGTAGAKKRAMDSAVAAVLAGATKAESAKKHGVSVEGVRRRLAKNAV